MLTGFTEMHTEDYFSLAEYYRNKIWEPTFSVNLLDLQHFIVASGADDLDEGLLVGSEPLET